MPSYFRLRAVETHRNWKIYNFAGYVTRAEMNEMLDWAESLPNQQQYESLLTFHVISDMSGPPCYSFSTNLYGKEVAGPFWKRWRA